MNYYSNNYNSPYNYYNHYSYYPNQYRNNMNMQTDLGPTPSAINIEKKNRRK